MKIKTTILISLAATQSMALGIAPKISTLGYGLDVSQQITENLYIKLNTNNLNVVIPEQTTSTNISLQSYGFIVGYNVYRGLNVEAGLYKTNGAISQHIFYSTDLGIASGSVSQDNKMVLDSIAPYLGLSYISNYNKGFFVGGSLGIMLLKTEQTTDNNINYTVMGSSYTLISKTPLITNYIPYPLIGFNLGYNF